VENDKSLLKWSVAAVATVVVCFLLGYFVLPNRRETLPESIVEVPRKAPETAAPKKPTGSDGPGRLALQDVTARKTAEQQAEQDRVRAETPPATADQGATGGETPPDDGAIVLEPDNASVPPPDPDVAEPASTPAQSGTQTPPSAPERSKPAPEPKTTPDPQKAVPSRPGTVPRTAAEPRPNRPGAKRTPKQSERVAATRPNPDRQRPKLSEPPPPKSDIGAAGPKDTASAVETNGLLRVRVGGTVRKRSATDTLVNRLRDKGFKPMVLPDDGGYVIQIGAFRDKAGAQRQVQLLENAGFSAVVR